MVLDLEFAYFDMQINGETICTAYASQTDTPINDENTSCMAVSYVAQGIKPICFKHFWPLNMDGSDIYRFCCNLFIIDCIFAHKKWSDHVTSLFSYFGYTFLYFFQIFQQFFTLWSIWPMS